MMPGFEPAATDRVPEARFSGLPLGISSPFYGSIVTGGNNPVIGIQRD
jgi:hypothetical protein